MDDFEWNVTVGRYTKELTLLCEREGEPIISKCIREMRQELEKYDHIRSVNQQINKFVTRIEKELDKYEKKPKNKNLLKSENVEDKRGDPEEKMSVDGDLDGDLVEINNRIIRSFGISYNQCPTFFKV